MGSGGSASAGRVEFTSLFPRGIRDYGTRYDRDLEPSSDGLTLVEFEKGLATLGKAVLKKFNPKALFATMMASAVGSGKDGGGKKMAVDKGKVERQQFVRFCLVQSLAYEAEQGLFCYSASSSLL